MFLNFSSCLCDNCGKNIGFDEAKEGAAIVRGKLQDNDPRIILLLFVDICIECAKNINLYIERI